MGAFLYGLSALFDRFKKPRQTREWIGGGVSTEE
jgi:hypothetical protein